ncbi:40S ribosomal protein S21, putative [Entamoeba invadens IP1]|uniref:40S ribosomal protein S21 n=1 Tax=Entamoeba invadens IP1 TaxID=370355 RepID=A0A0A1U5S3_ENTIV|nr:40S ribosomal protein S21, putative [Entamoeba invadens IP1]ELP88215.1 40S ribosomal protein S21, putative [Entamoeba invadens IP1]|eukprot:XP_004254986.1 40S ribosomal protein S21, putative [Entamoeba invadens IP1]
MSSKRIELYIPRHCSVTHTLIAPDDHSSVQINVPAVDESGVITKDHVTFTVKGSVRRSGISDHTLNREFQRESFLKTVVSQETML